MQGLKPREQQGGWNSENRHNCTKVHALKEIFTHHILMCLRTACIVALGKKSNPGRRKLT